MNRYVEIKRKPSPLLVAHAHLFTFPCAGSSADRISNERLIKEHLRDIMRTEDLDNLTSKMVRCGQM